MNRLSNYKEHHQSIGVPVSRAFFSLIFGLLFSLFLSCCLCPIAIRISRMRYTCARPNEKRQWNNRHQPKINKISTIIISLKKWCVAIFCRRCCCCFFSVCIARSWSVKNFFSFVVVCTSLLPMLSITSNSDRYDFNMEFIDTFCVSVCVFVCFSVSVKYTAQLDFECVGTIVKNWQNYLINSLLVGFTWKRQQS